MPQSVFLDYQAAKVHCLKFGTGPKLLIALHGFGDRAAMFLALEAALSPHYTVYAIDLPYHGHTQWPKDHFTRKDIMALIDLIRDRERQEKFTLMGFSFGGRIVQCLLSHYIQNLTHLYLIAPDGLNTRWMFNLTMMPRSLRYLLRWALRNPAWFIKFIAWSHRRAWISKFVHDFAYNHIYTKERRDRIFCTWISLSDFKTASAKVKTLLKQHPIPVDLYFGLRDEVIPLSAGEALQAGLSNIRLSALEEGHLLVDQKLNALLEEQLNNLN